MDKSDTLIEILKKSPKQRTASDLNVMASLLDAVKFFHDLNIPFDDLRKIGQCLTYNFYNAGTDIIKYNSFGDSFYIIIKGTAAVLSPNKVENEEGEIETEFNEVATLEAGKSFGELALINNARRFLVF